MNLYMKQKFFSWGDKFSIYDEAGNPKFYVEGEVFTLGKKLHLYDLSGNELAYIEQKLFSLLPKYYIYRNGQEIAEVVKKFTFFYPEYIINGLGWNVHGDFFDHSYQVEQDGMIVASVSKQWFTLGDAYQLSIENSENIVDALAVCLVIDACIDAERNN